MFITGMCIREMQMGLLTCTTQPQYVCAVAGSAIPYCAVHVRRAVPG